MLDNKFMVGVMLFVCDGCLVVFLLFFMDVLLFCCFFVWLQYVVKFTYLGSIYDRLIALFILISPLSLRDACASRAVVC